MKSTMTLILAFLSFLLTTLASPTPNLSTSPQNITLTPRHVPGWCSFHAKLWETCDTAKGHWTARHQICIKYLLDEAKNRYPFSEHRYYIDNAEVWIGNEDKRKALDRWLVVEKWRDGRVGYRYWNCAWNEDDGKVKRCGWFEKGGWTKGDLGCEKRKGLRDRVHDMDCFFLC